MKCQQCLSDGRLVIKNDKPDHITAFVIHPVTKWMSYFLYNCLITQAFDNPKIALINPTRKSDASSNLSNISRSELNCVLKLQINAIAPQ